MATRKTTKRPKKAPTPKKGAAGSAGDAREDKKPPNKGGAPTVMTDPVKERFLTGIRSAAMSIRTAAIYAGVSEDTIARHRKRDAAFNEAVLNALDEFKAQSQIIIAHAGVDTKNRKGSWQARAWLLERRFPDEFGRRQIELSGPGGGAIPLHRIEEAVAAGKAIMADPDATHAIHQALGDAVEKARQIVRDVAEVA